MISLNTSAQKKGTAVVILCLIAVFLVNMHYKQYTEGPKTTPETSKRDDNSEVAQFGPALWSGIRLLEWFDTFEREIAIFGNKGGMRLPHQFAVYTTLRILKPKVVIESGVWRGFVSKLIRKISPDVHIISLDPVCRMEDTSSSNHEIMCGPNFKDFKTLGERWKAIDKSTALILFDDHQSGYLRTLQARNFGFKHIMLEDNFPLGFGDNYSLKHLLMKIKTPTTTFTDNFSRYSRVISREEHYQNQANFFKAVNSYHEFPPLNKEQTVECLHKALHLGTEALLRVTPTGLGIDLTVPERLPQNLKNPDDYVFYMYMSYVEVKDHE